MSTTVNVGGLVRTVDDEFATEIAKLICTARVGERDLADAKRIAASPRPSIIHRSTMTPYARRPFGARWALSVGLGEEWTIFEDNGGKRPVVSGTGAMRAMVPHIMAMNEQKRPKKPRPLGGWR